MTRSIAGLPILSVLCLIPAAAVHAAPIQYEVRGACFLDCSNLGTSPDGEMRGRIRLDDSGFSPGASVGNEALISYDFRMGNYRYRSTDAPDPAFQLTWGDTAADVDNLSIYSFVSNDRNRPAPALALFFGLAAKYATMTHDGYLWRDEFVGETSFGNAAYASVDSVRAKPVPLPAAGWLLAAGAASLWAAGRARRRAPA